jgi:ferredoxin
VWNFEKTNLPAKAWYFPMSEPILFIEQGTQTKLTEALAPEPIVMFGIRPCDARSGLILDKLFIGKPPIDRQYANHRKALTMIGLSCPEMWETCFCTAVGGAPNSRDGLDILLTEVDGGYAVDVITEKGEKALAGVKIEEKELKIPEPLTREGLPVVRESKEWGALFNDLYWKKLSDSCISCRACAFVCPTCRCYDVRDELVSIKPGVKTYERLRAWDTCTMAGYRRIAGGHNPRETTEKRLRNRFYCKFMYYPEDFGPIACIGCSRCIDVCPVGINIQEIIAQVDQMLETAQVNA